MKFILILFTSLTLFAACSSESKKSGHTEQVEKFLATNDFRTALQYLSSAPSNEETQALAKMVRQKNEAFLRNTIEEGKKLDLSVVSNRKALAKAHIDMGIFLEYYGEHLGMKERMTNSLAHFRKALQIDPGNEKAVAEIGQIEGIYKQMGRPVPEGIAD